MTHLAGESGTEDTGTPWLWQAEFWDASQDPCPCVILLASGPTPMRGQDL